MDVLNRGEVVGRLTDSVPDMWYLEGQFAPADTTAGDRFAAAASALDVQVTFTDNSRAIRTLLRESSDDKGTVFVVMSLKDGRLFGRCVFEMDAVKWATANVPE